MHILTRLKLRAKFALLLGLSALAVVVSNGVAASLMHQRMFDDRIDKLHSMSLAALGTAQALEDQVAAKQMTREQAQAQFTKAVHAILGIVVLRAHEIGANPLVLRRRVRKTGACCFPIGQL